MPTPPTSTAGEPDVVLIGSGIMSATLGTMLRGLDPDLKIELFEAADAFAQEASNGWHNAGTGHAGICESGAIWCAPVLSTTRRPS